MPTEPPNPDAFLRSISAAIAAVKALVVDAIVSVSDQTLLPSIHLQPADAIKAIQHLAPKVVCVTTTEFDVEAEVSGVVEEVGEDESSGGEEPDSAPILRALRKWQSRNGEIDSVMVSFVVDGVLYSSISVPDWREEFDDDRAQATDAALRMLSSGAQTRQKDAHAALKKLGAALAAHVSFNAGRPSFEKRLFLAGQLFADLDEEQLREVTSYAERLDWFNKTSRT